MKKTNEILEHPALAHTLLTTVLISKKQIVTTFNVPSSTWYDWYRTGFAPAPVLQRDGCHRKWRLIDVINFFASLHSSDNNRKGYANCK